MSTPTDEIGFVSQCDCCGQRAITRTQHAEYTCPRCVEVTDNIPYASAEFDDWPLSKVQG